MRVPHYDQVIQAAIEGGGVAIGKWPHLAQHLQEGLLCVPFGRDWVAHVGGFNLVVASGAETGDAVQSFVAWLRDELRRDAARTSKILPLMQPPSPQAGRDRKRVVR
jgi:LysR family glycine cleavage system transcriptional activator